MKAILPLRSLTMWPGRGGDGETVLDRRLEDLPRILKVLDVLPHALVAPVDAPLADLGEKGMPFDLAVGELEKPVHVHPGHGSTAA